MDGRYEPNGIPLTPHERELLHNLVEEAAEVIQAAQKLQRFGKENIPPDNVAAGVTNSAIFSRECGNFFAMMSKCRDAGLMDEQEFARGIASKLAKYEYYQQYPAQTNGN